MSYTSDTMMNAASLKQLSILEFHHMRKQEQLIKSYSNCSSARDKVQAQGVYQCNRLAVSSYKKGRKRCGAATRAGFL